MSDGVNNCFKAAFQVALVHKGSLFAALPQLPSGEKATIGSLKDFKCAWVLFKTGKQMNTSVIVIYGRPQEALSVPVLFDSTYLDDLKTMLMFGNTFELEDAFLSIKAKTEDIGADFKSSN